MPFSHSKPGRRTNEDVFFAYYPRLVEWASQITHGDRAEAEDLVQDFYLRVTRITRPIDEMEQLEHYLFKVTILSYRDMQNNPSSASEVQGLQASSETAQPTALGEYLAAKGWSEDKIGNLSYRLLKTSGVIEQESKAIAGLEQEFESRQSSAGTRILFSELLWRHKTNLRVALQQEQDLIAQTGIVMPLPELRPASGSPSLSLGAERGLALSNELTVARTLTSRRADAIVSDLLNTIAQLRMTVSESPDGSDASVGARSNRQQTSREN